MHAIISKPTLPSKRARSNSFVKRPLPPISERAWSRIASPCVFFKHTDTCVFNGKSKVS